MRSTPAITRARLGSRQSNAPAVTRLSSTRLLTMRGSTRAAKSASSVNGLSPRAATMMLDRLRADALDRGERVEDRAVADLEVAPERLTDGGTTSMPSRCASCAEFGELVGVAHVERHRRGQELDRVVRLQIGGLVGDSA